MSVESLDGHLEFVEQDFEKSSCILNQSVDSLEASVRTVSVTFGVPMIPKWYSRQFLENCTAMLHVSHSTKCPDGCFLSQLFLFGFLSTTANLPPKDSEPQAKYKP